MLVWRFSGFEACRPCVNLLIYLVCTKLHALLVWTNSLSVTYTLQISVKENTVSISLYSKILQYIFYRISTYTVCSIWQLSIFDYIPLTICCIFTFLVYSLSTLFIEQLNSHYSEHYSVILVYSGRVAEWHVDLLVPSSALHITKWG